MGARLEDLAEQEDPDGSELDAQIAAITAAIDFTPPPKTAPKKAETGPTDSGITPIPPASQPPAQAAPSSYPAQPQLTFQPAVPPQMYQQMQQPQSSMYQPQMVAAAPGYGYPAATPGYSQIPPGMSQPPTPNQADQVRALMAQQQMAAMSQGGMPPVGGALFGQVQDVPPLTFT
jgi:hypothetical protein